MLPHSSSRRQFLVGTAAVGLGAAISTTTATTSALGASAKTGATLALGKWIAIAAVTAAAGAGAATYVDGGIPGLHRARPASSASSIRRSSAITPLPGWAAKAASTRRA